MSALLDAIAALFPGVVLFPAYGLYIALMLARTPAARFVEFVFQSTISGYVYPNGRVERAMLEV